MPDKAQPARAHSILATIEPGDKFSVKVTLHQIVGASTITGATFTSTSVVIATASPDPITLV